MIILSQSILIRRILKAEGYIVADPANAVKAKVIILFMVEWYP
jgi:hypothetical protein